MLILTSKAEPIHCLPTNMKIIVCTAFAGLLISCGKTGTRRHDAGAVVEHKASEVLSPRDLGIQKESFIARPAATQVAVFRVEHINRLEPKYHRIYDQIYWRKHPEDVVVDVVIAPLSFYLDKPEADTSRPETFFRDSWKLRAGSYRYDVTEYAFVESSFGCLSSHLSIRGLGVGVELGDSYAEGEIFFTKNTETQSKDLEFRFSMFVLSLEDAKELHPELDVERKDSTFSWAAAYFYEP